MTVYTDTEAIYIIATSISGNWGIIKGTVELRCTLCRTDGTELAKVKVTASRHRRQLLNITPLPAWSEYRHKPDGFDSKYCYPSGHVKFLIEEISRALQYDLGQSGHIDTGICRVDGSEHIALAPDGMLPDMIYIRPDGFDCELDDDVDAVRSFVRAYTLSIPRKICDMRRSITRPMFRDGDVEHRVVMTAVNEAELLNHNIMIRPTDGGCECAVTAVGVVGQAVRRFTLSIKRNFSATDLVSAILVHTEDWQRVKVNEVDSSNTVNLLTKPFGN